MSLILTWENPPAAYEHRCHAVQVWRGSPNQGVLLCDDATWGVYEDETEIDIKAEINVVYIDKDGGTIETVFSKDLRRYLRPTQLCRLEFNLISADGGPDDGRLIEITDVKNTEFVRRVLTNRAGKAVFFGMREKRFRIYISGEMKALDCVMPGEQTVTWPMLSGTWIDADRRSKV